MGFTEEMFNSRGKQERVRDGERLVCTYIKLVITKLGSLSVVGKGLGVE